MHVAFFAGKLHIIYCVHCHKYKNKYLCDFKNWLIVDYLNEKSGCPDLFRGPHFVHPLCRQKQNKNLTTIYAAAYEEWSVLY